MNIEILPFHQEEIGESAASKQGQVVSITTAVIRYSIFNPRRNKKMGA